MNPTLSRFPLVFGVLLLAACNQPDPFQTWKGIGPDKWASIWLINKHIDSSAKIQLTPVDEKPNNKNHIAFDIPQAQYKRTSQTSTIASLAQAYNVNNNTGVNKIAEFIHDIEVISWGDHSNPRSAIAEVAYRDLQKHYGRDKVPPACYMEFFDKLEVALLNDSPTLSADDFKLSVTPEADCANRKTSFESAPDKKQLVAELPVRDVLSMLKAGKKVVFIDAREENEFDEFHIPGAVNIQLRKINETSVAQFADADQIVAYCLKDFRGFELAKAMKQRAGIEQVAILNPYGINGWRLAGLPVTGTRGLTSEAAEKQLRLCVANPDQCLSSSVE